PAPGWICVRWLKALGKYSYGIYVWHWPVQLIMVDAYAFHPARTPAAGAAQASAFLLGGVLLSLLCGWASYLAIERPFLRLKRFFGYEGGRRVVHATPDTTVTDATPATTPFAL